MGRDRVFTIALAVSLMVHLSAVTLFSIVITFPRSSPASLALALVPPEGWQVVSLATDTPPPSLAGSSFDLGDIGDLRLEGGPEQAGILPRIELPTLHFAELERLGFREKSLALSSHYDDMFRHKRTDSWSRFGEELGGLSAALSRLRLSWGSDLDEGPPEPATRPAEGFETYIEWFSEPKDRQLIYSPPIEALWDIDPAKLEQPITMVFAVNPAGKVVEIMPPVEDEAGIVASTTQALWKYRFEPISAEKRKRQRGTLVLTRARGLR